MTRALRRGPQTASEAILQRVVPVEVDHRGGAQSLRSDPLGEPAIRERALCDRDVPEAAERRRDAPGHRLALRRHRCHDGAVGEQLCGALLILAVDLEGDAVPLDDFAEDWQEPGDERVGIHRERDPGRLGAAAHRDQCVVLEERQLAGQPHQRGPGIRRLHRLAAAQHHAPDALLDGTDALADGAWGDGQSFGRPVEGAGIDGSDQRAEVIEREFHCLILDEALLKNHEKVSLYFMSCGAYVGFMTLQLLAFLSALGLVLGLIVSIGGQNAYLLRQGIRKQHVGALVLLFAASDAVLQTAGVLGISHLVEAVPMLGTVARWAGAAFLVGFAVVSARRAWRGGGSMTADAPDEMPAASPEGAGGAAVLTRSRTKAKPATLRSVLLGGVLVTWLNPHAIVETTVVIGSVSTQFGDDRLWFLLGGICASTIWFVAFGYGARFLAPLLRTERAWRILDAGIAVVMIALALMLVVG